ncbi:hypothetical protein MMC25_000963 [Agyrium rufum]|nr:hypothetical protein [Agyrium rufum]
MPPTTFLSALTYTPSLVSALPKPGVSITNSYTNHTPSPPLPKPISLIANSSSQQITNPSAFTTDAVTGNGGNTNNDATYDGICNGTDTYNCYCGSWQNFPPPVQWVSFQDMWNQTQIYFQTGCTGGGQQDDQEQIDAICSTIQEVAKASLVDHRLILAVILQESSGYVYVGTTFNNNAGNPGLMQSAACIFYNGTDASIVQMIIDSTQGTASGNGLVQGINQYGNVYDAARACNSGTVDQGNLNDGEGATASYVFDVANRLVRWVGAESRYASCYCLGEGNGGGIVIEGVDARREGGKDLGWAQR